MGVGKPFVAGDLRRSAGRPFVKGFDARRAAGFAPGPDPRRFVPPAGVQPAHELTREECVRGYWTAVDAVSARCGCGTLRGKKLLFRLMSGQWDPSLRGTREFVEIRPETRRQWAWRHRGIHHGDRGRTC